MTIEHARTHHPTGKQETLTTIPVYVQSWNGPDKARLIGEASDALEMEDVAASHGIKFGFLSKAGSSPITASGDGTSSLTISTIRTSSHRRIIWPRSRSPACRRSSKRCSRRRCRHPRKFHAPRPCGYWASEPAPPLPGSKRRKCFRETWCPSPIKARPAAGSKLPCGW